MKMQQKDSRTKSHWIRIQTKKLTAQEIEIRKTHEKSSFSNQLSTLRTYTDSIIFHRHLSRTKS